MPDSTCLEALACNHCSPADCLHSWLLPCSALSCSTHTLSQPWHLDQGDKPRAWARHTVWERDWSRPKVRKPCAEIWKKCRENKFTSVPFAAFEDMWREWGEVGAFMCSPKMVTGKGEKLKCGWTCFGKWDHWVGQWGKRGVGRVGKGQGALQATAEGDASVS